MICMRPGTVTELILSVDIEAVSVDVVVVTVRMFSVKDTPVISPGYLVKVALPSFLPNIFIIVTPNTKHQSEYIISRLYQKMRITFAYFVQFEYMCISLGYLMLTERYFVVTALYKCVRIGAVIKKKDESYVT